MNNAIRKLYEESLRRTSDRMARSRDTAVKAATVQATTGSVAGFDLKTGKFLIDLPDGAQIRADNTGSRDLRIGDVVSLVRPPGAGFAKFTRQDR